MQIDDFQKYGKDAFENASKTFNAFTKTAQAVAAETADYSKKSLEGASSVTEKVLGAKSLDKAFEIQSDYLKSAYEGFVAYAARVGDLYQAAARDAVKPYETMFAAAKAK
ncbi:MAG: Phasin [Rhizobiales bacterium 65-9]|nr:phasin family protein [Hyphomicrobiales bacterium]OJY33994.1 MAG: Phasin [Rhizobiales bacterium 65-9]